MNTKKILSDFQEIIKVNENFTLSCLTAKSLIENDIQSMISVLNYENVDDVYIEVDLKSLQSLVSNAKVCENIILQAALSNFETITELKEYCNEHNININSQNIFCDKFKVPSLVMLKYQKYLMMNNHLLDDNMMVFLDTIECDQRDNAKKSYMKLNNEQKKTIPKLIKDWIFR